MKNQSTDWTEYYSKPKSKFSTMTQKITLKYILDLIDKVNIAQWDIMECGGGNSCFAKNMVEKLNARKYDIIDKCEISVWQATDNAAITNAYHLDLTQPIEDVMLTGKYNLVYSVGLIEHFSDKNRDEVIKNHFKVCCTGGYVLITAPTPTLKYRLIRKCMELLHVWQFWDECPIKLDRLIDEIGKYGTIVYAGINKKLPLTQAMVLAKTN